MAFGANDSKKSVIKDSKFFTGITVGTIKAVNPSLEEMNKLEIKIDKEPSYNSGQDEDGNNKFVIDFWVEFKEIHRLQKLRFFLTDTIRFNRDGLKKQMIDKTGRTCWISKDDNTSSYDWIDNESLRNCHIGEEKLTNFLINWLNIKPGDVAKIDDFKNSTDEIKKVFKEFLDNKVRCMLIVNHADNGKTYQNIYDGYFDRATTSSFTYWEKHINNQIAAGYPIKGTYSYTFQEYKPVEPTSDTDNADSTDNTPDLF